MIRALSNANVRYWSSQSVYSKLRVNRLENESFSLFIDDNITLGSLKDQISAMYQSSDIRMIENAKCPITHNDLWYGQASWKTSE